MVQNSNSCPRLDAPLTGTRFLYAHLQFRLQKCRKPVKKLYFFIRYNSKIRYILNFQILHEIYTYLLFLIVKFEPIICNILKFVAC